MYKATLFQRPTIIKERFAKAYRLKELDEKLNQTRITQVTAAAEIAFLIRPSPPKKVASLLPLFSDYGVCVAFVIYKEVRCLAKARAAGVGTPAIYLVDVEGLRIYMEYVHGRTVKQTLREDIEPQQGIHKCLISLR